MEFNLFIDRIYYLLQLFSGHLNGHNSFFLVLSDAYVHAVPLVVRTINSSKNYCTIIIRHYCFSSHLIGRNNDFLVLRDAYVNAVPLCIRTINILSVKII